MRKILFLILALVVICGIAHAQPTFDWEHTYAHLSDSTESYVAIKVDPSGDIVTTGESDWATGIGESDIVTTKLNPAGDTLWVRVFDKDSSDKANDMAIDHLGNIYVAGEYFDISLGIRAPILIKYLPNGDTAWTRTNRNPLNNQPEFGMFSGVDVDAAGNVFAAGGRWNSSIGEWDFVILKFNTSGTLQWRLLPDLGAGHSHWATHLEVSSSGDIFIAGERRVWNGVFAYYDIFAAELDKNTGSVVWQDTFTIPDCNRMTVAGISTDSFDNLYLCGSSQDSITWSYDIMILKFEPTTGFAWGQIIDGAVSHNDFGTGVEVTSDDKIIMVASIRNSSGNSDFHIAKYNSAGFLDWSRDYNPPNNASTFAHALTLDSLDNIYVTGEVPNISAGKNIITVRYDQSGTFIWEAEYPDNSRDHEPTDITVDSDGSVYICGFTSVISGILLQQNFLVIKYEQTNCCDKAGDFNDDGATDISDLTATVDFMFKEGDSAICENEADCDGSCTLDISDLTYRVDFMFRGGPVLLCGCVE